MTDPRTLHRIIDLRTRHRLSLRKIGTRVGLSGEQVRKLLVREGISMARTTPQALMPKKRNTLDEAVVRTVYGCSVEELAKIQQGLLLSDHTSPAFFYRTQRYRYLHGNGWAFTFPDWWQLWKTSWSRRVTESLVMIPTDRSKPVALGNAEILTRSQVMKRFQRERRLTKS